MSLVSGFNIWSQSRSLCVRQTKQAVEHSCCVFRHTAFGLLLHVVRRRWVQWRGWHMVMVGRRCGATPHVLGPDLNSADVGREQAAKFRTFCGESCAAA
jgi:hypothetical protein